MLKPVLGWLAPAGARARLSILIFHRVLPRPDPFFPHEIDASQFDEICGWLAAWFNVLPLDDAERNVVQGISDAALVNWNGITVGRLCASAGLHLALNGLRP